MTTDTIQTGTSYTFRVTLPTRPDYIGWLTVQAEDADQAEVQALAHLVSVTELPYQIEWIAE